MKHFPTTLIARVKISVLFLAVVGLSFICRAEQPIQAAALDQLVVAAEKSHTDALVIWQDGKPVGEWYFGKPVEPLEAMSATKSVVSLAIGKLITDVKIKSLDQPVWEFYPEWKQGRKKNITLRHLLNHTSGLQNFPRTDVEIYASPDYVQLALTADMDSDPGASFRYNNKAVNLLAGIVQKASSQRLDLYLRDELFAPLGITNFTWKLDAAGNPQVMSGLQILPADFAKLGQLALNRGRWEGRQLIADSWFDVSMRPAQEHNPYSGLLWWLMLDHVSYAIDDERISELETRAAITPSAPADFAARAKKLKGRYKDTDALYLAMDKAFGREWPYDSLLAELPVPQPGKVIAWYADGSLGQQLVVVPGANLVAVRMISSHSDYNPKTDSFDNFRQMVLKLVTPAILLETKK